MTRQAALNLAQITGVDFLAQRDIRKSVIDTSNEMTYLDLMALGGKEKLIETGSPIYHQFTDEDSFKLMTIDAGGVSGSGTATLAVTLDVASSGYARPGLVLKFPNVQAGYISSAITTTAGKDSFTVKSCNGGNLVAAAGNILWDLGIVVGAGSTAVSNLVYTVNRDFNLIQRMRDVDVTDDVASDQFVEVIVNGVAKFVSYQSAKKAVAFEAKRCQALMFQKKSAKQYGDAVPLVDAQGNPTQFTGGIYEEASTKGVNVAWASLGSVTLADLDNEVDAIIAVKGCGEYLKLCPSKARRAISSYFKNLGSAGITSAKLEFGGNEISAFNYTVDKLTHDKEFEFASLKMLDHPQGAGISVEGKSIYGIPKEKVKTIGGGMVDRIMVRYTPHGITASKSTGMVAEWETGAMAITGATDDAAVRRIHYLCNFGNEMSGTRHFTLQRALA